MSVFGYDPEVPAGFQDADFEQRAFEAEGAEFYRRERESKRLRDGGALTDAAKVCPHGSGYPLSSMAADYADDPNEGEDGYRCRDCGSRLSASPWDGGVVTVPCELVLA